MFVKVFCKRTVLVALSVLGLVANRALATTRYFDTNGITAGSGITAAGAYSWESAFWNSTNDAASAGGTSPTTNWTDADFPKFAAGNDAAGLTYTVTASAPHVINGMQLFIGTASTVAVNGGATVNVNAT